MSHRVSYQKEDSFNKLIVRLRDDDSTMEDRNVLLEENISFFKTIHSDKIKLILGKLWQIIISINKKK